MNKNFSLYLDFVRVTAAMLVLLGHFSYARFSGDYFNIFANFTHDAVILFFVLSGYVISYVSDSKDLNFSSFWISRFSRLYSVVIPAIIITLVADNIGMKANALIYDGKYIGDHAFFRIVMNMTFLQQVWNFNVRPFSNGPFWSLSYEFWYYAIFAACFYFKGFKRYVLALLFIVIAGPKILLLFPLWLLGSYLYRKKIDVSGLAIQLTLFFGSGVLYVVYKLTICKKIPSIEMATSSFFINDYIVAVLFSIHLVSARSVSKYQLVTKILDSSRTSMLIKYIASSTFSIYLLHFPLLLMWTSILNIHTNKIYQVSLLLCITLINIFIISEFTEKKKTLYKKFFTALINIKANKLLHRSAKSCAR